MMRANRQALLLGVLAFGAVSNVAHTAEHSRAAPAAPDHQDSFEISQPDGATHASNAAYEGGALPFHLNDHTGAPFDRDALSGHFTLVYFGYTHCTDVCPIGLSVMASTLREMPEYEGRVEGAFITVDPARDSAETLQKYVGYFHPAICGVRGTAEETARAADYFEIVFRHGAQNGKPTVEHSDTIIVLDENGIEQKRFPGSTRPSIIRSELTALLAQSDNTHQKR